MIYAPIFKRFAAFFIDEVLVTFLLIATFYQEFAQISGDEKAMEAFVTAHLFEYFAINYCYQTFFVWQYGATLGKMGFRITCVNAENLRPNFANSSMRALAKIIGMMLLYIPFFAAFSSPKRQTLHDILARTYVTNVVRSADV